LHSAGEHGFLVLFICFGGRGGDFGKVDVFAVEEVRGEFDVVWGMMKFEVREGFKRWLGHVVMLLVCLVDDGDLAKGVRNCRT